ncbi:hypothetical protein C8R46DRAFT_1235202 [Mycena filopes]|nr:hypothetical protein C8R46DRAFT_1235202 [Mycena filopes]
MAATNNIIYAASLHAHLRDIQRVEKPSTPPPLSVALTVSEDGQTPLQVEVSAGSLGDDAITLAYKFKSEVTEFESDTQTMLTNERVPVPVGAIETWTAHNLSRVRAFKGTTQNTANPLRAERSLNMEDIMWVPFEVGGRRHEMEWRSPGANGGGHWSGKVKDGKLSIRYEDSEGLGGQPMWKIHDIVEFMGGNSIASELDDLLSEVLPQIVYYNSLKAWKSLEEEEVVEPTSERWTGSVY